MPAAFEIDGPLVARLVDARLVTPLDTFFTVRELADFLPTIRAQGSIDEHTYALGAFDSAMVLYYDSTAVFAGTPHPTQCRTRLCVVGVHGRLRTVAVVRDPAMLRKGAAGLLTQDHPAPRRPRRLSVDSWPRCFSGDNERIHQPRPPPDFLAARG